MEAYMGAKLWCEPIDHFVCLPACLCYLCCCMMSCSTPGQLKLVSRLLLSLPPLPQLGWRDVLIGGLAVAVAVLAAKLREAGG